MEIRENSIPFGVVNQNNTQIQAEIAERFKSNFECSEEINAYALYSLGLAIEKYQENCEEYQSYSYFLYAKLIEHHQSVLVLLKRGAISSSRALVRTMIECHLYIAAIINEPTILNDVLQKSESEHRKLLNGIIKIDKEFKNIDWNELGFTKEDLKIPEVKSNLSVESLRPKAYPNDLLKQKGWYHLYRQFSVDNHSTNDSLNIFLPTNHGNFDVSLELLIETLKTADETLIEIKSLVFLQVI